MSILNRVESSSGEVVLSILAIPILLGAIMMVRRLALLPCEGKEGTEQVSHHDKMVKQCMDSGELEYKCEILLKGVGEQDANTDR